MQLRPPVPPTDPQDTGERGSALVTVMLFATMLFGALLALTSITQSGFTASVQRETFEASLVEAEDIGELFVRDVQFGPTAADPVTTDADTQLTFTTLQDASGTDQAGYDDVDDFVANQLAGSPGRDTLTRYYDEDGLAVATLGEAAFEVDVRSAYRHWRNTDVDWVKADTADPAGSTPALPRVDSATRASLVEGTLDYYEVTIDNDPALMNDRALYGLTRGEPRQIQVLYRVAKPHFPGALYLDGGTVEVRDGSVIDGRDHLSTDITETHFEVPFSSNIEITDVPHGEAGYDSQLYYVDPKTGDPILIFDSIQDIWAGTDSATVGSLIQDADGNVVTFGANEPLDFFIEVKNYSSENIHHLFGHTYFAPDDVRDHGRKYGYAWDVRLDLKDDVDRAALGQELWDHLGSEYPDLQATIADPAAFKADPTGGDGIITLSEDTDGDGTLEVEDDVDGNGILNTTHGDGSAWSPPNNGVDWAVQPVSREDTNGNGIREDGDRRLAEVLQSYIAAKEQAVPGNQWADSMDLYMGFEDLPGYGSPDWDYDDVLVVLNVLPNGDQNYDDPNPPSYDLAAGKPAVVSAGSSFAADTAYDAGEQIRTAYSENPDGSLNDVYGASAYLSEPMDAEVLLQGYLDTASVQDVSDSAALTAALEAIDPDDVSSAGAVIHVQNGSGSPVVIEGNTISRGVLIVDGDLELHDNAVFYGAIFVRGTLTMTSTSDGRGAWVFGSVVSLSSASPSVYVEGNAHVAYSSEALERTRQFAPVFRARLEVAAWRRMR